jgi:APA family basic amino acid/polyamine antiporter
MKPSPPAQNSTGNGQLVRGLKLFDATTLIMGSMIGSGIFIVSADMARSLRSPGLLLIAWGIAAVMTVLAALSYGELAAAMPRAGGQYVFLREAFRISLRLDSIPRHPDRDDCGSGRCFF